MKRSHVGFESLRRTALFFHGWKVASSSKTDESNRIESNHRIKESNRQPTSNGWTEGTPQHTHARAQPQPDVCAIVCAIVVRAAASYWCWNVVQQLPVFWRWSYIEKARRNHCFCCSFRSTNVRVPPSIHWIPFVWLGNLMLPIWWREDICTYSNVHTHLYAAESKKMWDRYHQGIESICHQE